MSERGAQFSLVTVPFPFTDRTSTKRRPALVLSSSLEFGNIIGHSVMAMITSSKNSAWPLDVLVKDFRQAGLPSPSVVRMKLFTLDHRLVMSHLGQLSTRDTDSVKISLKKLLLSEKN